MDELLEELIELVDLTPRNNLNLCYMGGLPALLYLIFVEKKDSLRKTACRILSSILGNNSEVQEFAMKEGAMNLSVLLEIEKDPKLREPLMGCLTNFLKSKNFEGKRQYIAGFSTIKGLS